MPKASSEGNKQPSIPALLADLEKLRVELAEARGSGATKAELEVLRADIDAKLDELKAAKKPDAPEIPPAVPTKEPDAPRQETLGRKRRGFFSTAA